METEEPDDLTDCEDVADHRDRARNLLPQITQQVRQALNDADIDLDVFLMIPASGDAVATFGRPDLTTNDGNASPRSSPRS